MRSSSFAVALVLAGLMASPARAEDRSAEAILKDIDAVKMPQLDPSKTQDREYVIEYLVQWGEALQKRNLLILELFQSHPENDRLPDLMVGRWQSMLPPGADTETIKKELDQAMKSGNAKLRTEARFFQVRLAVIENRNNPSARAGDRSAEAILKDIDALREEPIDQDRAKDQKYLQEYVARGHEISKKRNVLILELYRSHPEHPRVPKLMGRRWSTMPVDGSGSKTLAAELEEGAKSDNPAVRVEALAGQVRLVLSWTHGDPSKALEVIKALSKAESKGPRTSSPRGVRLLYAFSMAYPDQKAELEKLILEEYPESAFAKRIKDVRKREESLGKPVELEFTDAISGRNVSMKDLKGKVVVLDFWATWCGPCVGEMPHMKELYAKYKDQGVEFIGVSLDHPKEAGGLDALKEFVKKNEITWPQYYQGNGWESEFSRGWGINAIPCVFVVGPDGNLYSVEARGKLETMIPELLEEGKKKPDEGE